jgi:hypothetical protein
MNSTSAWDSFVENSLHLESFPGIWLSGTQLSLALLFLAHSAWLHHDLSERWTVVRAYVDSLQGLYVAMAILYFVAYNSDRSRTVLVYNILAQSVLLPFTYVLEVSLIHQRYALIRYQFIEHALENIS